MNVFDLLQKLFLVTVNWCLCSWYKEVFKIIQLISGGSPLGMTFVQAARVAYKHSEALQFRKDGVF